MLQPGLPLQLPPESSSSRAHILNSHARQPGCVAVEYSVAAVACSSSGHTHQILVLSRMDKYRMDWYGLSPHVPTEKRRASHDFAGEIGHRSSRPTHRFIVAASQSCRHTRYHNMQCIVAQRLCELRPRHNRRPCEACMVAGSRPLAQPPSCVWCERVSLLLLAPAHCLEHALFVFVR